MKKRIPSNEFLPIRPTSPVLLPIGQVSRDRLSPSRDSEGSSSTSSQATGSQGNGIETAVVLMFSLTLSPFLSLSHSLTLPLSLSFSF